MNSVLLLSPSFFKKSATHTMTPERRRGSKMRFTKSQGKKTTTKLIVADFLLRVSSSSLRCCTSWGKMFFLVLNSFVPFPAVFAFLLWLDLFSLSFLDFTSQVSQEYLESVNVLLLHVFHFSCLPHGKSLSKSLNFSCFAFFFSSSSSSLSSSSWLRFAFCRSLLSVFRFCQRVCSLCPDPWFCRWELLVCLFLTLFPAFLL